MIKLCWTETLKTLLKKYLISFPKISNTSMDTCEGHMSFSFVRFKRFFHKKTPVAYTIVAVATLLFEDYKYLSCKMMKAKAKTLRIKIYTIFPTRRMNKGSCKI